MALSADIPILRVGVEGLHEPIASPLKASAVVYSGSIALLRAGYIVNSATPQSTDICQGLIGDPTGGTYVKTGPGITAPAVDGAVFVDVETGTFLLASGTGSDALTEADAGATVYVINESSVGKTTGGGSRPSAGVMLPIDPTMPSGFVPVQMNRGT